MQTHFEHFYIAFFVFISLTFSCKSPDSSLASKEVSTFGLEAVKLLEGPFLHATQLNKTTLLTYQADRLLAKFRSQAGLEPKAEHYHGWEDETIAGHSLGHYLSACALMFKSTGEKAYLDRVNYIVNELDYCQQADGDGYIGAFPNGKKIYEEEIAKGDIRPQSFNLNGLWAPFYTQHKILAGLRDAYRLTDNPKALKIASTFADWILSVIVELDTDHVQKMLECEHGGMNEVLVDLYVDTGDSKYLDMSYHFHHKAVLDSLAHSRDILPGIHGNTQIPKLIGLARRYQVERNDADIAAASFFWDRVVNHHSYVTGGHGNHEYFGQPDKLRNRLSKGTTESCNVYNMLKLSSLLFELTPNASIADFYERALFNHILSSQHPVEGKVIYNLSLEMGGHKEYQDPEWFTCCVGTGMENHSKYGQNIYYHNERELYVSQYIASELSWEEKGIKIRQTTTFPEESSTVLEFEMDQAVDFALKLRYPYWAEEGVDIKINGVKIDIVNQPSSFVTIQRKWNPGDRVDVDFPFSLRIESMPDDPKRVAIMYGPLVLAGDLGEVDDPRAFDDDFVPVILTENLEPSPWVKKGKTNNEFHIDKVGHPRGFKLIPFYKVHDKRYSVYWDIFNKKEWGLHLLQLAAEKDKKNELEAATYDFVDAGIAISEADHNFQQDKTNVMDQKNRKARQANRGGWFSYELKVLPEVPMSLVAEYWGGYTGSKTFDVLVDDVKIATENISSKKDGHFFTEYYSIPDSLTLNKSSIEVKFLPHEGHRAGPLFELRTTRQWQ